MWGGLLRCYLLLVLVRFSMLYYSVQTLFRTFHCVVRRGFRYTLVRFGICFGVVLRALAWFYMLFSVVFLGFFAL